MKRFLALLMAVGMLLYTVPAMAAVAENTEKWNSVNMTANKISVVIPNSYNANGRAYIKPGAHRIVSLAVTGTCAPASLQPAMGSTATEIYACIYDSSTLGGATNKTMEGEIEQENRGASKKRKYDRPLKVVNGIVLEQGAWTVATLEYERALPAR